MKKVFKYSPQNFHKTVLICSSFLTILIFSNDHIELLAILDKLR